MDPIGPPLGAPVPDVPVKPVRPIAGALGHELVKVQGSLLLPCTSLPTRPITVLPPMGCLDEGPQLGLFSSYLEPVAAVVRHDDRDGFLATCLVGSERATSHI